LLVDAGADGNKQDEDGRTALMIAARHGREHAAGMMRLLLKHGGHVAANKQNKYGWTALIKAAAHGGEHGAGMMRVLLDAGADANKQSEYGLTALMIAAQHGGEYAAGMMRLLVARGATLPSGRWMRAAHIQDEIRTYIGLVQDWTPLQRAAHARDFDALFALLPRGDGAMRPDAARDRRDAALAIAASDAYACAAPVDERCVELLRCGPVWSKENHALCPAEEQKAASTRALMTDGRGIGPVPRRDGGEPIYIPKDVWRYKIFSFLIFEDGYRDGAAAEER